MTTGLLDTRPTKVGDVLKFEAHPASGYHFVDAVVTVTSAVVVGTVLESTSVAGKFTLIVVATTADADGVLLDETVNEIDPAALPGDFTLAVLVDGPAQVAKEALTFGADVDTQPEIDAVVAALETNTRIKTRTQV